MVKFPIIHLTPGGSSCLGKVFGIWLWFCCVEMTGFDTLNISIWVFIVSDAYGF